MAVTSTLTTVILSWMPPESPNGIIIRYQVRFRIRGSGDSLTDRVTTDLTYTVTGLMTNTEYQFRVRATTAIGYGPSSNIINVFVGK